MSSVPLKRKVQEQIGPDDSKNSSISSSATVSARFQTADGEVTGPPLSIPAQITPQQLTVLLNKLLDNVSIYVLKVKMYSNFFIGRTFALFIPS
jgi:ribosome assembly protein 4